MTTYSTDPALYLFTSLTAGSSHIVTATSRLETILRANRVPFKAVDVATDEKARMLWGRRAQKDQAGRPRKLPGLVQEGFVLGDLVEVEDWNEYGELKQHVKIYYDEHTIPSIHDKPPEPPKPKQKKKTAAAKSVPTPPAAPPLAAATGAAEVAAASARSNESKSASPSDASASTASTILPIRSVADEAAQKAKQLRLKSLREKVHGASKQPDVAKSEEAPDSAPKPGTGSETTQVSVGLQSPNSATWRGETASDSARDSVQSPTSSRWRRSKDLTLQVPLASDGRPSLDQGQSAVKQPSEPEAKANEAAKDTGTNEPAKDTKTKSPKQENKSTAT
ncbi:hypothetical protein CDD81_559 [Ophiocordyceps australis]|uniref:Uncharacterized protein n=1 Tax=Ophiocordyceps australis TaxID=1399860 RepID=A0A2C5YGD0_9HYPO|nr:hypothetical protein CDD81_559 [Ophiocordyceps australis]